MLYFRMSYSFRGEHNAGHFNFLHSGTSIHITVIFGIQTCVMPSMRFMRGGFIFRSNILVFRSNILVFRSNILVFRSNILVSNILVYTGRLLP